jgi:hypothetical protein
MQHLQQMQEPLHLMTLPTTDTLYAQQRCISSTSATPQGVLEAPSLPVNYYNAWV